MTGRLLWGAPRSDARLLVRFEGTDDVLNFCDVRRFGEFWIAEKGREDRSVGALGPEPLEPMDEADFARRLRRSRAKLHAALLDQKRIAGLGNIYVTEALWRAGWRPTRRARALPAEAVPGLLESVREALRDGLARRGVSFRDYRDAWGEKGRAGETLAVYGRAGKPCPRCGTTLKGVKVGGRGTAFCPRCQR
jgi:formamidopyrimidine-DNA glycosylase